ncbi:Peroxisomal membrane protein [Musa troglodytarum]|uniref:Peroxisomal membrane protein n=1 Tax=Musa troglodytarum TaxID=320322 RepID=A0A9E7KYJ1_9LILI|nr:Peroxisomal membrane protein [Musa troglodytarum]
MFICQYKISSSAIDDNLFHCLHWPPLHAPFDVATPSAIISNILCCLHSPLQLHSFVAEVSFATLYFPHLPIRTPMTITLDATRAELALLVLYLNKAEARDKICRAIQYGSKFLSNGKPGTAQNVDKTTSLARKVFRLFKFVNDLHALITPPSPGSSLPVILLGKSKNALLSTFLFLDQIVWASRTGIYKNKERAELLGRISLYCWMGSSACTTLLELGELGRISSAMTKLEKELKQVDRSKDEQYRNKIKQLNQRQLALIKASMDFVVAIGLLQLAPKKITPRVTGALGFTTSLISCYQLLPAPAREKKA